VLSTGPHPFSNRPTDSWGLLRAIRIIYHCAHDMPYTSAIFLADLPTMSDRRDQLARKLFKSTIQPTSSLHNLLPPPREHPFITRLRVPSKFPRIPIRTKKNTNHSSHMLSPTIRLHYCALFHCVCCFLCLFLCLLSTIIVQPLIHNECKPLTVTVCSPTMKGLKLDIEK